MSGLISGRDRRLRWGILATGQIAHAFARGVVQSHTGELAAAASRSLAKAEAFAGEFRIPRAYGDYAALLADPELDAIYIATTHPQHRAWALAAIAAGKAVLCEKPLCVNAADTAEVIAAAQAAGVLLMEAYMYRCHPVARRVAERVQKGDLGILRRIQSAFCSDAPFDPASRLWNPDLAGGGILDVGGYPLSWVKLLRADAPDEIYFAGRLASTGVDELAEATLTWADGLQAEVACAIGESRPCSLKIEGSLGTLLIANPFVISPHGEPSELVFTGNDGHSETEVIKSEYGLYAYEADAFGAAWQAGADEVPAMPHAHTLAVARQQDAWRVALRR